jgi:DNA-binding transcriptional LysR family regulator
VDIENLKTFLEVYKTRHFGKAADNLFLTPAAVSARIKQLEQYLGVSVFIRNRGNVQLTSEGERLLPHAEHLLQTWAATLRDISLQKTQASSLQIGATAGLWHFALAARLTNISEHLPNSHIQAEALPDEVLVRRLLERSMDIAILYEPPKLPQLKTQKIGQLKLLMAATDKHQKAIAAFQAGYVHVDWGESFEAFHGNRFGDMAPPGLSVNLASIAVSYLEAKPGSAFLPQRFIDTHDFLYAVKGVPTFNRAIYAIYREGHERPELLKQVIGLLEGIGA